MMFSDKAQAIISSAKDRAWSRKLGFLDIESVLSAVGMNSEAGVRLAECLGVDSPAALREKCPEYGTPDHCPDTLDVEKKLREVIESAAQLAGGNGVPDRTYPGRIMLEHLVCAVAMSAQIPKLLGKEVQPVSLDDARQILNRWLVDRESRISLADLTDDLGRLRRDLLKKVFGQDHAVHAFVEGLYNAQVNAGADSQRRRPMGVFVFAGPPGVGKTYISELCSAFLNRPFRRFDMTSYSDHQANNELVGFAPSYKGAKPGLLTGFVKDNPNAFLLFDEIEKAHLTTMQLFYQILDAGRLQDKFEDEDVSFKDTIIIFTTNAGKSLYDNPNQSGIGFANAAYHKQTILNALENEKNPANGQPAFPQAICSRLGQGYPVMFNRLGVNELERIVDTEMKRTEALLEFQHFKTFSHDVLLPVLLVLSEGVNSDARQLRSEAERFVKTQLFKFSNLYESRRLETILDKIDHIHFEVNKDELAATPDIGPLFDTKSRPVILLAANPRLIAFYSKEFPEVEFIGISSPDEAVEKLAVSEVDFIVLDLWMEPGEKGVEQPFDTASAQADFIPLASRSLNTGRKILTHIHERFPLEPVYLLSSPAAAKDEAKPNEPPVNFQETVTVDAFHAGGFSGSRGTAGQRMINDDLFLACVQSGGARGLISTNYGFNSFDDDSRIDLLASILSIQEGLRREKAAEKFGKQRRSISFETSIRIDDSKKQLLISLKDFRLKRVMDAADVGQMVNDMERPLIGFDDVFGAKEAKQSMAFVVNWLKNPKRYQGLGLQPPKGILMTGPPGTGKTMLAKAVAGESDTAFCQESAANFVTKWQGSGPENIRNLFARARKYAPSIVFIDEIDAIGKARQGSSVTQAQENTLNALLTEMDGFGSADGPPVIVLAATNLADKLDPALKRRFDREVVVNYPDRNARLKYLRFTFARRQRSQVSDETIQKIASQSLWMTIADLSRIVQEAGVMASLEEGPISDAHLLESFDKFRYGEQSITKSDSALLRIARHEAGHAFVGWRMGRGIFNVTIIGRDASGGHVEWKRDDVDLQTKPELENYICSVIAGRAAELELYGEEDGLSVGVGKAEKGNPGGGDLPKASQMALDIVRGYGMTEEIGQISLDVLAEHYATPPMSEKTLKLAEQIVSGQLKRAREMIRSEIGTFNSFVDKLLENNRLDEAGIEKILGPQSIIAD